MKSTTRHTKYTVKNAAGLFYTGYTESSTLTNARLAEVIRVLPVGTFSLCGGAIYSQLFAVSTATGYLPLATIFDEKDSARVITRVPDHVREVL